MTIKDIAKQCGVGVSTVSRALNNHPDINIETKEMILKVVQENHYVPNNTARSLKTTESNTIAVIAKAIDNPFFSKLINIFEKEIQKKKYRYFLQHLEHREDEIEVAAQLIRERKIKGIIFLGGYFEGAQERLEKLSVPFVISTMKVPEIPEHCLGSFVSIDDGVESYRAVDYLCKQGHERIGMLATFPEDNSVGSLRVEGYKKALENHGIVRREEWIRYMADDGKYDYYSMRVGYVMMQEIIEQEIDVTAVFAVSDSVAIGACKAIYESGKKMPQDYAVVGFDGLEVGRYYHPAISTVQQPASAIAKDTITMLFQMIKTKKKADNKLLEGNLLIRESSELKGGN